MAIDTKAPGEEVKSADHNALAGAWNGTSDDDGHPLNAYRYNSAAGFAATSGNQDTTNGLIHLFQYGTVGAATEAARITKAGILGKLRDQGGWTFNLGGYSTSTLNTATTASTITASDAAWTAVFNAIRAAGGGTITLGTGTFLAPTAAVSWSGLDNTIIAGAGIGATTLLHPGYTQAASTNQQPILFFGLTNCGVTNLTIDGNRTNNNGTATGHASCEVSIEGVNCWTFRVEVKDFNYVGIGMSGQGNSVIDCKIGLLTPPSSYTEIDSPVSRDYGAIYGIQTGAGDIGGNGERDLLVSGCEIYGTRSAGIFIGGTRLTITGCHVYDCHREFFPSSVPAPTGGGQIAIAPTTAGARSTFVTITDCHVGPTTGPGGSTSGFELSPCDYVNLSNFTVYGIPTSGTILATGITLDQSASHVSISNGTINGCAIGLNVGSTVALWGVSNVSFTGNTTAVSIATSVDQFAISGCRFEDNSTNWSVGTLGNNWSSGDHIIVGSGGDVPHRIYKNATAAYVQEFKQAHATGYGLRVEVASTSSSQFALNVVNGAGGLLQVFGDGQVNFGGLANGQLTHLLKLTELVTITSGVTPIDTSMQIPSNAIVKFVTVRVVAVAATTATYSIGVAGATGRYGTGIADTLNGTFSSPPIDNVFTYTAAASIRITPNAAATDSLGRLRITAHYETATAATS